MNEGEHTMLTKTEWEAVEIVAKQNPSQAVAISAAKSFQLSAANWYDDAHKCEHTGSGPEFREIFRQRGEFYSAMARMLMGIF
jgi:hypothetical protein